MKADPFAQLKLLDVQGLDLRADQLRHQRANLPELAEMATLQASRTTLDNQARDARIEVDDLTAEQKKVDADVEQVKARRVRDRDRMDKGLITNPKDLERMQHELVSLERRISSLEDDELEVMARLEDAQRSLDELAEQVDAADARLATLAATRDEKLAEIDAALTQVAAERATAVEGMPADLMALYEKLRTQKGGVGAAALHQRRCTGCQLGIDTAELAVIKKAPSDEVVRCEECSRILVRTPESGL
ncbi:zinc ribbon domain-containing protein [Nocardioides sp. MAHUQ-72]|uniref:zinc ribbon domain-containing protein n=1 Tax=Nocardioides sp. MAHUQ-72 TaxID=3459301 RepID=UPI004040B9B6